MNPHVEEPKGASLEDVVREVVWQRGVVPYFLGKTFYGPIDPISWVILCGY